MTSRTLPVDKKFHQQWKGFVPVLAYMRVFGAKFWYATFGRFLKNLDHLSHLAILIRHAEQSKAFKLLEA